MAFINKHNGWLRHKIEERLKAKHPELFIIERLSRDGHWVEELTRKFLAYSWFRKVSQAWNFVCHRDRYILIPVLVLSIFALGSILYQVCPGLNILVLKSKSAEIIIDQRATNTATIISMTIAVIGFLISNLAVRESFAFKILFENSRLYPIMYFTLSTIGSLILVSLLRDTIPEQFPNLVVTGTYLVLTVLFLIGYLFRKIIHFTNSQRVHLLLNDELMRQAKQQIIVTLFLEYSKEEYARFLKKDGASEYNFFEAFRGLTDLSIAVAKSTISVDPDPRVFFISDVNLISISAFLKQIRISEPIVYYSPLALNMQVKKEAPLIWPKGGFNTSRETANMWGNFKLTSKKPKDFRFDARDYFDVKLEDYVGESKHRNVKMILNSYLSLIELEMKTQTKVKE